MYALGAVVGLTVGRRADDSPWWPVAIRSQTLAAATLLGVVAAWRLRHVAELGTPVWVEGSCLLILVVALRMKGDASRGEATLWSWAATSNTSFWVIPLSTAIAGPTGAVVAVLADRLSAPRGAWSIHALRADAPVPQAARTAWIDQAPLIALGVGLLLHAVVGTAPGWTAGATRVAGPWLALTGAALFAGAYGHRAQTEVPVTPADRRRLGILVTIRVVSCMPLLVLRWGSASAVVVALNAFSVPAFLPVQLTVLYGYRTGIVRAAARWGWVLAPAGLAAAALAR